jgi:hypothetical protein
MSIAAAVAAMMPAADLMSTAADVDGQDAVHDPTPFRVVHWKLLAEPRHALFAQL